MMTDTTLRDGADPRDILKLTRCPQCDYDLTGLPRQYQCPECGFEYDPSLFALYGWPRRERLSIAGRLLAGTWCERVTAVAGLAFMAALLVFEAYRWWQGGRSPFGVYLAALMVGVVAGVIRLRTHSRPSQGERWGPHVLLFSTDAASIRRGPGAPSWTPWRQFRRLKFRKLRFQGARRSLWHLRLSVPFWRFRLHPSDVLIECSRREAALIRGEIRRRLQAARPSPRA